MDEFGIGVGLYYRQLLFLGIVRPKRIHVHPARVHCGLEERETYETMRLLCCAPPPRSSVVALHQR